MEDLQAWEECQVVHPDFQACRILVLYLGKRQEQLQEVCRVCLVCLVWAGEAFQECRALEAVCPECLVMAAVLRVPVTTEADQAA